MKSYIHHLRQTSVGGVMCKFDFCKAFDKVFLRYIFKLIKRHNFHQNGSAQFKTSFALLKWRQQLMERLEMGYFVSEVLDKAIPYHPFFSWLLTPSAECSPKLRTPSPECSPKLPWKEIMKGLAALGFMVEQKFFNMRMTPSFLLRLEKNTLQLWRLSYLALNSCLDYKFSKELYFFCMNDSYWKGLCFMAHMCDGISTHQICGPSSRW